MNYCHDCRGWTPADTWHRTGGICTDCSRERLTVVIFRPNPLFPEKADAEVYE